MYFLTYSGVFTKLKRRVGPLSLRRARACICLALREGFSFEEIDMEDVNGNPIRWKKPELRLAARQIAGGLR